MSTKFSILHISDLHRDLNDEIQNGWLLDSIERDFTQFDKSSPKILKPELCIVSGDLVYGASYGEDNSESELSRQYAQVEEFLIGLAERLFGGDRHKIVILPGNHDVCLSDVMGSLQKIETPKENGEKLKLVKELFLPRSKLRWSWTDLCFYRIADENKYNNRFRFFADLYSSFYRGKRIYSLDPENQYDIFDFQDLNFCVIALNSCFNNDPLSRAGAFNPNTLASACRLLRESKRIGWLSAVAWHHNLAGTPNSNDYLDDSFIQLLIDAGASLGFHGHQHLPECFDEHYQLGNVPRKMTVVSASTLCADPRHLRPGIPRSYNVVEVDLENWNGRVHQRQMVNTIMNLPVWGPGYFINTGNSFFDFKLCQPLAERPTNIGLQNALNEADRLLGSSLYKEAIDVLKEFKNDDMARVLLISALEELNDGRLIIEEIWPPVTNKEAILIGYAVIDCGSHSELQSYLALDIILNNTDASVREIKQRAMQRGMK